jgi:hypothetical protein
MWLLITRILKANSDRIVICSARMMQRASVPSPRSKIEVERKGRIRDWPERASYLKEIKLQNH